MPAESLLPAGSIDCLSQLGSLFGNLAALAASCGADGWLLAASATDGGAGDALQLLHTKLTAALKVSRSKRELFWGSARLAELYSSVPGRIAEQDDVRGQHQPWLKPQKYNFHSLLPPPLQDDGLACLPSLGRLAVPDVHNGARTVHRRLRQLGSGSLTAGLSVLAGSEDEQRKLADVLGVEPQVGSEGGAGEHG